MKYVFTLLISTTINLAAFTQFNVYAYHPMTAPGALSISPAGHILYWENPDSVIFNEVYFSDDSSLVANLDPSALILSGEPSTVYDSVQITTALPNNTKYYWCIEEWYLINGNFTRGFNIPVWYFYTYPGINYDMFNFDSDLEGWQPIGPQGIGNWYWSNTAHTPSYPGEMVFSGSPSFIGTSFVISPEIAEPAGLDLGFQFRYYLDFNSDTASVGFGITTDNGNTWEDLWELNATGDTGPDVGMGWFTAEGNFRIGFFYSGNSANINYFYADEVWAVLPLTIPAGPPDQLEARGSYTEKQVTLNWDPGWAIDPIAGYRIQRQDGLPEDNNPYATIAQTGSSTFSFIDSSVNLDQNYTYRVCTFTGGYHSYYSNEATAYVPPVVPVELVSFTAGASGNNVILSWTTATETNNRGFEIQRSAVKEGRSEWKYAGFVDGNGTTTESRSYVFNDCNLSAGTYDYRIKQINYDGSFEYSKITEVNVNVPGKFSLGQNYPNPFNPATSISFTIPVPGFVSIKVYDVLGNEVRKLVNENKSAGMYNINFDAGKLTSGVYFYALHSGSYYSIKKMILLR